MNKKRMNTISQNLSKILIGILAFLVVIIVNYWINPMSSKIIIHEKPYFVEVAATNAEKAKGLGYRDSLPKNKGMVFPYDHRDTYIFWMKGMNFPLDFLWVYGNLIVDVTKNVPVMTGNQITTVKSLTPVDKVIEFNAGFIDENNIKIGDTVTFKN
jgi:uncharacterized protein